MKNYKFCPYCGNLSIKQGDLFTCSFCKKKVYVNSLPAASVFIIKEGRYTLCERAIDPMKGKYDFIGGFLNNGEHPTKGAIREVKEETGLEIEIISLLGVYMDKYEYQKDLLNILNFVYIVTILKGNMKPQDDISSVNWFPINQMPENIAFKSVKYAIKDLQKWYKKNSNLLSN